MNNRCPVPPLVVYVASPFTYKHHNQRTRDRVETERFAEITRITAQLITLYQIAPIAPITMSYMFREFEPNLGTEFSSWERIDKEYILHSDELWIAPMDGWRESVGVQEEIRFARQHHIPVKIINLNTLEVSDFLEHIEL